MKHEINFAIAPPVRATKPYLEGAGVFIDLIWVAPLRTWLGLKTDPAGQEGESGLVFQAPPNHSEEPRDEAGQQQDSQHHQHQSNFYDHPHEISLSVSRSRSAFFPVGTGGSMP